MQRTPQDRPAPTRAQPPCLPTTPASRPPGAGGPGGRLRVPRRSRAAAAPTLPATFLRLAWSNLAAQSAEQVALAAAPILAVLALGAGTGQAGLLQTAQTLPFLLLSIPAGVLADRMPRRRLMAAAEALRTASLLAVLALAWCGGLTLGRLAALGFLGAVGTVVYGVCGPSLVPALVPRVALPAANARIELARSAAFAVGPALGGVLVGGIGAPAAFGLAAALSAGAALLLRGLAEPARPALPARAPLHELREGAGFALSHPLLRPVLLTAVVFNTAFFLLQAIYVPYAAHRLGLSASGIGMTLAAYGAGMVCAALAAAAVMRRLRFGTAIVIGPAAGCAASLAMAATIQVPSPWLAGLCFFLLGAGPTIWVVSSTTLRQVVTPERMLGRVSAIIATATFGARPLGAALGALVGAGWGAEACLVLAAFGFLAQFGIILLSPAARLAALPASGGPSRPNRGPGRARLSAE